MSTPQDYAQIIAGLCQLGFQVVNHRQGSHRPFDFHVGTRQFKGECGLTTTLASFHLLVHPEHILVALDSIRRTDSSGASTEVLNRASFAYQINCGFKPFNPHLPGQSTLRLTALGEAHLLGEASLIGSVLRDDPVAALRNLLVTLAHRHLRPAPFSDWFNHPLYLESGHFYHPTHADYEALRPLDKSRRDYQQEVILATHYQPFLAQLDARVPGLGDALRDHGLIDSRFLHSDALSLDLKEAAFSYFEQIHARKLSPSRRARLATMLDAIETATTLLPPPSDQPLAPAAQAPALALLSSFSPLPVVNGFGLPNLLALYCPRMLVPFLAAQSPTDLATLLQTPNPAGRFFSTQILRDVLAGRLGVINPASSRATPDDYLAMLGDYFDFATQALGPDAFSATLASPTSSWLGELFYGLTSPCQHFPSEDSPALVKCLDLARTRLLSPSLSPVLEARWDERGGHFPNYTWTSQVRSASDVLNDLSANYAQRASRFPAGFNSLAEAADRLKITLAKRQLDRSLPASSRSPDQPSGASSSFPRL